MVECVAFRVLVFHKMCAAGQTMQVFGGRWSHKPFVGQQVKLNLLVPLRSLDSIELIFFCSGTQILI